MAPLSKIKINKNVPVPVDARMVKYPFRRMSVGDSFFVEGTHEHRHVRENARAHGETYAMTFVARPVVENDVQGTRVWRVA